MCIIWYHKLRRGCVLFDIQSRQQRRTFIATPITSLERSSMRKHQPTAVMPTATTIDDKVTVIVKVYWYENRNDGDSVTTAPQRIEETISLKDILSNWLICQDERKDMISPRRHNEAGRFTVRLTRNTTVWTSVR